MSFGLQEVGLKMILAIIQARMSSSRLPGKVMQCVMGRPLLSYMIERLKPSRTIDQLMVATSDDPSDSLIAEWCKTEKIACFRGNLHDVLDRFYQCAISMQTRPDTVIRLTADCPLHHYEMVDWSVSEFKEPGLDYFTNSFPPDFEDGFDVEVFSFKVLKEAWLIRKEPADKEHLTLLMRNNPLLRKEFKKFREHYQFNLSVDTPEQMKTISSIFERLYPHNPFFTMDDVIELLNDEQNPLGLPMEFYRKPV